MTPRRITLQDRRREMSQGVSQRKRPQQALISRFFMPSPPRKADAAATASLSDMDTAFVRECQPCGALSGKRASVPSSEPQCRLKRRRRVLNEDGDSSSEQSTDEHDSVGKDCKSPVILLGCAAENASSAEIRSSSIDLGNISAGDGSKSPSREDHDDFPQRKDALRRKADHGKQEDADPSRISRTCGAENRIEQQDAFCSPLDVFERRSNGRVANVERFLAPRDENRRRHFEAKVGRLEKNSFFLRRTGGSGGGGDDDNVDGANSNHYSSTIVKPHASDGCDGARGQSQKPSAKIKYTPLEQQFVDIKSKHEDLILLVECGYKYRFFGSDADVASRVCRIYSHFDHNFNTASIPTVRLSHHVNKLVQAGYKVGVVRQIETAALKRASDRASGPFERKLCEVYSRGTLLADGNMDTRGAHGGIAEAAASAAYIVAFCEQQVAECKEPPEQSTAIFNDFSNSKKKDVRMGLAAVDTGTGEFIFDVFDDDLMRPALETRLMSLEPVEIVVDKQNLSKSSDRTIVHYCQSRNARLERVSPEHFERNADFTSNGTQLTAFLPDYFSEKSRSADLVLQCISALVEFLKQFQLENCLDRLSTYRSFAESRQMLLDANVLRNFEIFHNSNDSERHGSLLSLIDRTRTPFGSRRIKQWLAHPLTNADAIRERLLAVDVLREIVDGGFDKNGGVDGSLSFEGCVCELTNKMAACPDLERGLGRISNRRCSASDFIGVARAFRQVAIAVRRLRESVLTDMPKIPTSKRVATSSLLLRMVSAVPDISSVLQTYVFGCLDEDALDRNDYPGLYLDSLEEYEPVESDVTVSFDEKSIFLGHTLALRECRSDVRQRHSDLDSLLEKIRRERKWSWLEWKKVAQDEFLLEVPSKYANSVPKSWVVVNQTKSAKRFRPREAAALLELLEQARERCDEQASLAWRAYLSFCEEMCVELRKLVDFLAELDCLSSLARVSALPGFVKPVVLNPSDFSAGIHAVNARHPIAEAVLNISYVPNDVNVGCISRTETTSTTDSTKRCMVLTGPNMGGKSSYIRMCALLAIMTQVGSFVPADSARVSPFDALFCRMGASDAIGTGLSTLMVELAETSRILSRSTERSLVVLDELGRGTSTHDGTAIAFSTLMHLTSRVRCVTLFVTHFPLIAKLSDLYPFAVGSYFMDFAEEVVTERNENIDCVRNRRKITFLYKVKPGVAAHSYGLNVAEIAGLPLAVTVMAEAKAVQHENDCRSRRMDELFRLLNAALATGDEQRIACAFQNEKTKMDACRHDRSKGDSGPA